jgi:hypothetical protein
VLAEAAAVWLGTDRMGRHDVEARAATTAAERSVLCSEDSMRLRFSANSRGGW